LMASVGTFIRGNVPPARMCPAHGCAAAAP
jgi:hypothetical protein